VRKSVLHKNTFTVFLLAAVALVTFHKGCASAAEMTAGADMEVLGPARAPLGYVGFCVDHKADCAAHDEPQRVILTTDALNVLKQVNITVNTKIAPVTDKDLYHRAEFWTYPVDRGDCEDYVLLKRKLLIAQGWPVSALLITVVRDTHGDGHAVLTVATDEGDLVLDNQRDDIRLWDDTGYSFVKRQSQADPNAWVMVGPSDSSVGVASTR